MVNRRRELGDKVSTNEYISSGRVGIYVYIGNIISYITIIAAIILYSRFVLLFREPIAMLGVSVISAGFVSIIFSRPSSRTMIYALFLYFQFTIILVFLVGFVFKTGLEGDYRTIGNFCGLFAAFSFVTLINNRGLEKATKDLYVICLTYVMIYTILGYGISSYDWFSSVDTKVVILADPWRGRRLFPDGAIISFCLFFQLARLRAEWSKASNAQRAWIIAQILVSLCAFYISQARVIVAIGLGVGAAVALNFLRSTLFFSYFYLAFYFVFFSVGIFFPEFFSNMLSYVDPDSLGLRIQSMEIVNYIFTNNPIIGLGIPGDATFYGELFPGYYYPEDLGGFGILANFGILGEIWVFSLFFIVISSFKRLKRFQNMAGPLAMLYSGVYCIITASFWPTLIYGDGSLFFSFLFAVVIAKPLRKPAAELAADMGHSAALLAVGRRRSAAPAGATAGRRNESPVAGQHLIFVRHDA